MQIQQLAQSYDQYLPIYVERIRDINTNVRDSIPDGFSDVHKSTEGTRISLPIALINDEDISKKISETINDITSNIMDAAQKIYSPSNELLSIEIPDYFKNYLYEDGLDSALKNISFQNLAEYYDETYGGTKGLEIVYGKAVKAFDTYFRLTSDQPKCTVKKKYTEFQTTAWIDSFSVYDAVPHYSTSTKERLIDLLSSFAIFFSWNGDETTHDNIRSYIDRQEYYLYMQSREKILLGSLEFVTFKSKITFNLSHSDVTALKVFISKYGHRA